MSYLPLSYLHLLTVAPAFMLATILILRRKGTDSHKLLGKVFVCLILFSAITTLFMPAEVGPQFFGHFGFIHLLSLNVVVCAIVAVRAARRGNIKTHKANMISIYVFGFFVAGGFAFMPDRLLHKWLFE